MEKSNHTIKFQPLKIAIWLVVISFVVVVCSLIGQRPIHESDPTRKFFLDLFAKEFFVNSGENITTYWNMFILIIMAVLTFAIAAIKSSQQEKNKYIWWLLGMVFSCFAIDELSLISNKLINLLQKLPEMEGGFLYNWFYPATTIIVLLLFAFFTWFYIQLDAKNKILFPIAILFYVLGAFRNILISGQYASVHGNTNSTYLWMTHTEELVEHLGIILMIYLLLTYLANHRLEIKLVSNE
jgi:hypothetical protein